MKFSAQILTEELRFDGFESSSSSPVHFFESDSMSFTIEIRPRSAKRARQSVVHQFSQFNKISENEATTTGAENFGPKTASKDARVTKFSAKESDGGDRPGHRQEEEELRRKMQLRKPSRKISREGDYLVVQDKMGIKLTQAGTMQIKEVRCKIGSDEYFDFINKL